MPTWIDAQRAIASSDECQVNCRIDDHVIATQRHNALARRDPNAIPSRFANKAEVDVVRLLAALRSLPPPHQRGHQAGEQADRERDGVRQNERCETGQCRQSTGGVGQLRRTHKTARSRRMRQWPCRWGRRTVRP